jgi:putative oxidoreductase
MKNVALLGGLALAAIDTEGRPGLAWRASHAGQAAKAKVVDVLPG